MARSKYSDATRDEAATALSAMALARAGFGQEVAHVEQMCDDPEAAELAAVAFECTPFVRQHDDDPTWWTDPEGVLHRVAGDRAGTMLTSTEGYAEAEAMVRDGWEPTQQQIDEMISGLAIRPVVS